MTTAATTASGAVYSLTVHVFVRNGQEQQFHDRLPAINGRCAGVTGFLGMGADADKPGPQSTRWALSYKFSTQQGRDDCKAILAGEFGGESDLLTAPPVFDSADRGDQRRPVEVVSTHIPPAQREQYAKLREEVDTVVAAAPGFVSLEVYPPAPGDDTWVTMITFDSQSDLDAWYASPKRRAIVAKIRALAPDEVRTLPTGFGQWFSVNAVGMVQTPAWKQAMTVLAVLFAMVSVLNLTIGDAVGPGWTIEGQPIYKGLGLPFPVVVFIGNAIGTILLTWVLMPIATRLLAWWLDPGATRRQTITGIVILLIVYVVEVTIFTTIFRTLGI